MTKEKALKKCRKVLRKLPFHERKKTVEDLCLGVNLQIRYSQPSGMMSGFTEENNLSLLKNPSGALAELAKN